MKKLTILAIIACVGLLVGSAAVIGGPAGPPGGLDVNVISPDPLPVTGTVTGDVNATVTGDVNVVNTPDVNVVNDVTNPVPVVISEGPIPFQSELYEGGGFIVPEGKLASIEFFNGRCDAEETSEILSLTLQVRLNDEFFNYYFPASQFPYSTTVGASQQVKIFVQAGAGVSPGFVYKAGTPPASNCKYNISGYFYPVTE